MKFFAKKVLTILFLLSVFSTAIKAEFAPPSEEGKNFRLKWKDGRINIALSVSLTKFAPNVKIGSDVAGAVKRSLATWEKAANIKFNEVSTEKIAVSPVGNTGDGVSLITIAPSNENLLMFGEDAAEVSAKTRIFHNRKGIISEADIVLNPYVKFSDDGTFGTFDLEAVFTHEIGHLLGLEHTNLCASSMHTHQAQNGIYNLPQTFARTLSDSDIAAIRALYGTASETENCCGKITGKISLGANVSASGFRVWLEDFATGKVRAGTTAAADGSFLLDGLTEGRYKIFAEDTAVRQKNRRKIYAGDFLGEVAVEKGKTAIFDKEISLRERGAQLKYVGFNGQISNVAVPVSAGKSYQIYVGGENLSASEYKISVNSPFIRVKPKSTVTQDFGSEISVLSFEIIVENDLPKGDYTIVLEKNNGEKHFLVGALTSDFPENPWDISGNDSVNKPFLD